MAFTWSYSEDGGYDYMTDAIHIWRGRKIIATLDLSHFGQSTCEPVPADGRAEAERLAAIMVTALNHSAAEDLRRKG